MSALNSEELLRNLLKFTESHVKELDDHLIDYAMGIYTGKEELFDIVGKTLPGLNVRSHVGITGFILGLMDLIASNNEQAPKVVRRRKK
ncbi:MAG: hypothetical protein V1767_02205 [Chloroflexota bacterium]